MKTLVVVLCLFSSVVLLAQERKSGPVTPTLQKKMLHDIDKEIETEQPKFKGRHLSLLGSEFDIDTFRIKRLEEEWAETGPFQ